MTLQRPLALRRTGTICQYTLKPERARLDTLLDNSGAAVAPCWPRNLYHDNLMSTGKVDTSRAIEVLACDHEGLLLIGRDRL